jgi:hypothetical protein
MNRALSILLVAVLVLPRVAESQDTAIAQPTTWGIMAGRVSGTGTFPFSPGIAVGALAQFPLSSPHLSIRADAMANFLGNTDKVCDERGCASQGLQYAYVVSGSASLVARMNEPATRWSPYVFAGPAVYLLDNAFEFLRPNHFGLQGGVGFEYRPSAHTFFTELRYMSVPPGGVLPLTIGMRF